jgi:hypothetical protein
MLTNALTIKWRGEGYLEIDKSSIQAVEVQKKLMKKKYSDPHRWQQAHVRLRSYEHR